MTINYRSTPEIIDLANEIQSKNEKNLKKNMESNIEKNLKPKLLIFDNLSKEINFIVTSIISDLKRGFKKKQIAILCRTNMPLYFLEEQLQKNGVKNRILTSENYLSNCISLCTIHSAKGLEWDKVYLVGMNNSYFPNPKSEIEEERRLFYVAVTRAKYNLVITLNKNDSVSNLLLELSENLFIKDFTFNELSSIQNSLPNEKQAENSVTKILGRLNGQNFKELKELNIFEGIKFTENKLYEPYIYPDWVIKEDYYAEFGCFIDYLIRRMIANNNKNWNDKYSGFYDRRADEVITSIFLNNKLYQTWGKYYKGIISCIKLYQQKNKISKKEKTSIFEKFYKDFDKGSENNVDLVIDNIINNIDTFSLNKEDIKVTNKIFLPFAFREQYLKSYLNFKNKDLKWNKILYEIFLISKCHSVWGDRRKCLYIDIKKDTIKELDEFYQDIYKFVDKITKDKMIFCNPDLNNGMVYGDADLIIENEIMDFKTSSNKDMNIEYTLQLLLYTSLARSKGMKIDKISIFNPLLGLYYYCDIDKWNKDEELIEYIHKII
jgi:hypothetical protein